MELASESLPDTLATFRADAGPSQHIAVSGICPTCCGIMTTTWPKVTRPVGAGDLIGQGWSADTITWSVVVECNCGHDHPGHLNGPIGCGTTLMIEVEDDPTG